MLETVALVVGLCWLLVSLPFAVLVGRCIAAGHREEPPAETPVAVPVPAVPAQAVPAETPVAVPAQGVPAVPAAADHVGLPAQRDSRTAEPAAPVV